MSRHRCCCHPMPEAIMDDQLCTFRGDVDGQGCSTIPESSPSSLLSKPCFQLPVQLDAILVPTTGMPDGSSHSVLLVWVAVLRLVLHDSRLPRYCTGHPIRCRLAQPAS